MDGFWYFIAGVFEAIFSLMDFMSPWFNKLLIAIGFIAFFLWLRYMSKQKEIENFD